MDFERARFNMVEQQVRTWEVFDQRVLETLMTVRREQFVPQSYRTLAFAEVEIPLGFGERMLRPVIEGKVLQAVQLQKGEIALEVGTGSGYFAACLAHHRCGFTCDSALIYRSDAVDNLTIRRQDVTCLNQKEIILDQFCR